MFQYLIFLFLFANGLTAMKPAVYPRACKKVSLKKLDPERTMLAFDLDEVVLFGREEAYKKWLTQHYDFAQAITEVKYKDNLSDAAPIINRIVERYPYLQEKAQQFQNVVFHAPQILGTIKIIEALHKKGYGIIAASNMTTSTYQAMVDNKTLPASFSREVFFVLTNPLNKKADGKYYEKPHQEYYLNLKHYIKSRFPHITTIIFIDDKLANTQGAHTISEIISIHFKNPEQLCDKLISLGIDKDAS